MNTIRNVVQSESRSHHDLRGSLYTYESETDVPFDFCRAFFISDVPAGTMRGQHAHKHCNQFLICQSGDINITCDDGHERRIYRLSPGETLLVPNSIWNEILFLTEDAILLVLTDHIYEESDYIRDYQAFRRYRSTTTLEEAR